jgi:tyrosine-protein phosphatase SIW14
VACSRTTNRFEIPRPEVIEKKVKSQMKLSKLVLFLAMLVASRDQAATSEVSHHVPRFRQIHAGLYRGGQPTSDGFEDLKKMGVRTVINLRVEGTERTRVEALGMKYVHIPIDMPLLQRPWRQIPDKSVEDFLRIVNDPANQPVFVHCQRGADRTGTMIALYRVKVDNWQVDKAYDEAREIGLRWMYRGFRNQILRSKG